MERPTTRNTQHKTNNTKPTANIIVMKGISSSLAIIMFTSVARAFSTRAVRPAFLATGPRAGNSMFVSSSSATKTTARQLSTDGGGDDSATAPDTSVVDVCQKKIQDALQADTVKVTGAFDDPNGSHISIEVVSQKFEGKRPVQRQQMVYKAIWEELKGPVHAVDSMVCKTPSE